MADKDETKEQAPEEQAEVAYYYISSENPTGGAYPGVPLGDVLTAQYELLPKWIQKSIAGSSMYSAEPPGKKKATPDKGKEK